MPKISELPAAAALTGTEEIPLVQSATTKKTTAQDIADLGGGGGIPTQIAQADGSVVIDAAGQITATAGAGDTVVVNFNGSTLTLGATGFVTLTLAGGQGLSLQVPPSQINITGAGVVQIWDFSGASADVVYVPVNLAPWVAPVPTRMHDALERLAAGLFAANGGVQF